MKEDLILNWIGFKFFVKMAKIKGCRNLKTDFETKPKKKKKLKPRLKVPFEIKTKQHQF